MISRSSVAALAVTALVGCVTNDDLGPTGETDVACGYPSGAVEPMGVGEVLTAYSWPKAIRLDDGTVGDLDLGQAPCNQDPDIDWSPFDVLLFVSVPAW